MPNASVDSWLKGRGRAITAAVLWKITRRDDVQFFFTDHDQQLEYEGDTYTPMKGVDASARQRQVDLEHSNLDIVGILDDDVITDKDLAGGLWRGAKIEELLVDWRAPWAGPARRDIYFVSETKRMAGETWQAKLQGLTRKLEPRVGRVYTRNCRHVLGDSLCGVDTEALKETGTVTSVSSLFRTFKADGDFETAHGTDSTHWDDGVIVWTSGDNVLGGDFGESEVKRATRPPSSDIEVELQLDTPFPIKVGDEFEIIPGCNKTADHCKNKFSNFDQFGGFPFIPGNDAMMGPK